MKNFPHIEFHHPSLFLAERRKMEKKEMEKMVSLLNEMIINHKIIISVAVDDDPYYSGDGLCDDCELDEEGNLVLCVTI